MKSLNRTKSTMDFCFAPRRALNAMLAKIRVLTFSPAGGIKFTAATSRSANRALFSLRRRTQSCRASRFKCLSRGSCFLWRWKNHQQSPKKQWFSNDTLQIDHPTSHSKLSQAQRSDKAGTHLWLAPMTTGRKGQITLIHSTEYWGTGDRNLNATSEYLH